MKEKNKFEMTEKTLQGILACISFGQDRMLRVEAIVDMVVMGIYEARYPGVEECFWIPYIRGYENHPEKVAKFIEHRCLAPGSRVVKILGVYED
jgi:hypothetical protein